VPAREEIERILSRLDEADLSPKERAALEGMARKFLDLMDILRKPGATLAELRRRNDDDRGEDE